MAKHLPPELAVVFASLMHSTPQVGAVTYMSTARPKKCDAISDMMRVWGYRPCEDGSHCNHTNSTPAFTGPITKSSLANRILTILLEIRISANTKLRHVGTPFLVFIRQTNPFHQTQHPPNDGRRHQHKRTNGSDTG